MPAEDTIPQETEAQLDQIWGTDEPPLTKDFMESPMKGSPEATSDPESEEDLSSVEPEDAPVDSSTTAPEPVVEDLSGEEELIPEDIFGDDTSLQIAESDAAPVIQTQSDEEVAAEVEAEMTDLQLSEKQKHAFSSMAYEKRELQRQNAELKEQAVGLSDDTVPSEELESRDDRIAELEKKIGEISLSDSPEFQKTYELPIRERLGRITNLLMRSGLEESDARLITLAAFQEKDLNARIDYVAQEAPAVHGPVIAMFEEVEDLQSKRNEALSQWQETRAALKEAGKRENSRVAWEAIEELSNTVQTRLKKGGNFLYNDSSENKEWNSNVSERVKAFRGVLQRNDMNEIADLVAEGIAASKLMDLFKSERSRRTALQRDLNKRASVTPSVAGNQGGSASVAVSEDLSNDELLEKLWG